LAKVLARPELLPDWAKHIDLSEFPKKDWNEETDGIAPTKPDGTERRLGNAAARIALTTIQHKLPQCASYLPGKGLTFARTLKLFPVRNINSQPLLLFQVQWPDSGPGFSWPESYHVTWIPYYDRFLVTASSDSKDLFGFEDLSLGSFAGSSKKGADLAGIRKAVLRFWNHHVSYGFEPWEGLTASGAIKATTVLAWRSRVWPKNGSWRIEEYGQPAPFRDSRSGHTADENFRFKVGKNPEPRICCRKAT
jgi:hypothetical protein